MPRSIRFAALAAVLALTGCGGGPSGAQDLLKSTFGGGHSVKSGNIALSLDFTSKGLKSVKGPLAIKLNGPFQSVGKGKLPKFDLSLALDSGGSSFSAGAVSTGDKGWLKLQGTTFAITPQLFQQFKAAYEHATGKSKSGGVTFKSLGIDPMSWLKDPRTVGTESVGGAETYHIAAGVDVAKFLDDLNAVLSKASALGGATGTTLPSKLTPQQRQDIANSVKSASLDVWTGKADKTLRRLSLKIAIDVPPAIRARAGGLRTGNLSFDLTIADLNQPQTITPPKNARPLSDLQQLLAAGGGGSANPAAPSASGSSGSGSGTSQYMTCVAKAGNDVAKLQQCAGLVGQ